MTIGRVKPMDWGTLEKLTSAQINGIDTNATYALDKRAGETDDLESVITLVGAGRLLPTRAVGTNSNATVLAGGENLITQITTVVTVNRTYTLGTTGAQTNDVLTFFCDPGFTGRKITFVDEGTPLTTLFVLGNDGVVDGTWVQFIFISGSWRVLTYGSPKVGQAYGVAPLDGFSKVPTENIKNAIVGTYVAVAGEPFGGDPGSEYGADWVSTGFATATGTGPFIGTTLVAMDSVALLAGDIISARAFVLGSVAGEGTYEAAIGVNGAVQTPSYFRLTSTAGQGNLVCRYTVPSDGVYTVELLHRWRIIEDFSATVFTRKGSWLEAEVIRP